MEGRIARLMLSGGAEARHLSALPMPLYTALQAAHGYRAGRVVLNRAWGADTTQEGSTTSHRQRGMFRP